MFLDPDTRDATARRIHRNFLEMRTDGEEETDPVESFFDDLEATVSDFLLKHRRALNPDDFRHVVLSNGSGSCVYGIALNVGATLYGKDVSTVCSVKWKPSWLTCVNVDVYWIVLEELNV